MIPRFGRTHDDAVFPGKRVVSWINALQFPPSYQKEEMFVSDLCRELGGAKSGDRTMLDALDPFVKDLKKGVSGKASRETILATVDAGTWRRSDGRMKPRLGRLSYLGDRVLAYTDPGAKAVAVWLRNLEVLFAR